MKRVKRIPAAVMLAVASSFVCQQTFAECGIASTYSSGSLTANGEHYRHMGISAAHKSLPFGTRVVVRNQRTGHAITVRINDRGPFIGGRIIDLSTGAKNALGMDGLASVCLEVVSFGRGKREPQSVHAENASQVHATSRSRHYGRSASTPRLASKSRGHHAHGGRPVHQRRLLASN